mmetsp:Transcript_12734/g.32805  ORF Transcript_12734/g.32805 Transcript_12734/m.32805 type:complete len:100 (-) Transcript_12734:214-513(-)
MSSLLSNLPSRGLLGGAASGTSAVKKKALRLPRRTPSAPVYHATHDTAPPADQMISTDESNRLLARFHAVVKEREEKGRQGKRQSADGAQGSAEKRSRK